MMQELSLNNTKRRPVVTERTLRGLEVILAQIGDTMGPDLIVGDVRGPMSYDLLREACFRVQQLHPTLRAAIRWPDGRRDQRPSLYTFAADREALDVVVMDEAADETVQKSDWRATHNAYWQWAAEEQSKHRFDLDQGFLFRVVWVPERNGNSGHVIICSHHAIVDGTSLMRLLNQIMQNVSALQQEMVLAGVTVAQAAARLPAVVPMPMSQALFSYLQFGLLEKALTWIGRKQAVSEQKSFINKPWLPLAKHARVPLKDLLIRTQCVFTKGENSNWDKLHKQCKKHGVTVGGAYSAAVQFAICRYLRERGMDLPSKGGKVAIPLSMDYNMRDRIDNGIVDANAIGLGTSIASVGVKVAPDIQFWDLARRIMNNARTQVKFKIPKLFQSVTDTIFGYDTFWKDQGIDHGLTGGAGDGVNISNVGRYPFPSALGQFSIENVFGFNGACLSGPLFIFWLRQVNGHLCYNAIACSPSADREMLHSVFAHVVEVMEQLAVREDAEEFTLAAYSRQDEAATNVMSLA
jgi:hypothetical protein